MTCFPPLPSHLSQLDAATRIVYESDPIRLEVPERLAMNMHHLAYLEGNPEQPYGIHLQLQSQAFYRMMIQHYYEYKLGPVNRALKEGKRQILLLPIIQGRLPDHLYDIEAAFRTYDQLVSDFWERHALLFFEGLYKRKPVNPNEANHFRDLRSTFSQLPSDRKSVFANTIRRKDETYDHHFSAVALSFKPSALDQMQRVQNGDTDFERKISNALASSSGSGASSA